MYPKWIDPSAQGEGEGAGDLRPGCREEGASRPPASPTRAVKLIDPKGDPVSFDDARDRRLVRLGRLAADHHQNLQDVGIDANVKLEPDWGAWQPNAMSTKFVTLLWNYGGQDVTPYAYFYAHYDPSQNLGAGVDASPTGNWEHYSNAQGAALLKQFKATLDPAKQKAIAYKLQSIFLDELPFVPLFIGPRWSTYSTKYFTGLGHVEEPVRRPDLQHPAAGRRRSCCRCDPAPATNRALLGRVGRAASCRPPDTTRSCAAHICSRAEWPRRRNRREREGGSAVRFILRRLDVLRDRLLGRDHAQLPAAAADAGLSARRR